MRRWKGGSRPATLDAFSWFIRARSCSLSTEGGRDVVMGARPQVKTAPRSTTAFAVTGLAAQLANALASVPFRRPWRGREGLLQNVGITVTRTVMRAFLGYATSLPTSEFRSLEKLLDALCRVMLPPVLRRFDVAMDETEIGGVVGLRYRYRSRPARGAILYLHGGGYIGTSPAMYTLFTGRIAAVTDCEVFVPDYRLAPEFPFPSSLVDAMAVHRGMLAAGLRPERVFLAGDSGGGGLVNAMMLDPNARALPRPAGLLLFSPEVSLTLDEPSITENAGRDILPWNIPVWPYLRGLDARHPSVSAIDADLRGLPPPSLLSAVTRCSATGSDGSSRGSSPRESTRSGSRSPRCSMPSHS